MLTRGANRRAFTLVEIIVAIMLAAIVLGAATSSALRQQRTHSRVQGENQGDAQVTGATLILGEQLGMLDRDAGDLTAGQAQDTALGIRALVAASIACQSKGGSVSFVPDTSALGAFAGASDAAQPGDSLWWLADSTWTAGTITAVGRAAAACGPPFGASGGATRIAFARPDTVPPGTPLRVTRQSRYGIYKASDGTQQLGFREWNAGSGKFAAPQPIAGPLVLKAGTRRSGFRYFDDTSTELDPAAALVDVRRVARIRITMHSLLAFREPGRDSIRTDSIDVPLQHSHP